MADNNQLVALNSVKALLNASKDAIASRLPRHLTADRMLKVALTSINKTPKLLECSRESLMMSIMQAAELGLEPGGALGEGYLIPYNCKVKDADGKERWQQQCQFIPGYRGLIALARRSGQIVSLEAHVVHTKDTFACQLGLNPSLEHTPAWEETDPGALRFVYAVAKLKDGGTQFEVMSKVQVEAIRGRSKAGTFGPWVTDYEEMARKTVVRRLFKYLPVSVEMAQALEVQASAEAGEFVTLDGIDETPVFTATQPVPELTGETQSQPATGGKGGADRLRDAVKSATRTTAPAAQHEAQPEPVKPNGHDASDPYFN
jgi:recombination protein RecT